MRCPAWPWCGQTHAPGSHSVKAQANRGSGKGGALRLQAGCSPAGRGGAVPRVRSGSPFYCTACSPGCCPPRVWWMTTTLEEPTTRQKDKRWTHCSRHGVLQFHIATYRECWKDFYKQSQRCNLQSSSKSKNRSGMCLFFTLFLCCFIY